MQTQKEIKKYFHSQVNPIFEPLIYSLAKYHPEDLLQFCIRWFKDQTQNQESDDSDNDQLFEDVTDQQFKNWRLKRLTNPTRKIRTALSSQVYGPWNKRKQISLRKGQPKDENIQMRILFLFMNNFLFSYFNQQQKKLLIQNMLEQNTTQGEIIIQERQYGDCMYFVAEGTFECYQQNKYGERRTLKIYQPGDIFGQLCFLHNSIRLATIQSKGKGVLYCLSRQVYRHIKKLSIVKKTQLYKQTMKKINIFENLQQEELSKICDVLTEVTYEAGKNVIIQGDTGNKFYIVLQGVLVAYKGNNQIVSQCFKEGDYFGQLALLNDKPRQATVKTITKVTLVYLTQDVFKRIVNKQKMQRQITQKYKHKRNFLVKKRGGGQQAKN